MLMTLPRFLLTTGFTIICLIIGARPTWAQDTTAVGSVSGVVTSGDGAPAAGVVLCLQTGSRCVTTNGGGVFKISDVRAGEFALEVTAPGLPTYPAANVRVLAGLDATVDITLPMIGGLATLGRWFIDRGMRKGTPAELHDQPITVYQGTGDWKKRLSYSADHKDDAYLIGFDRAGVVRWLHHGGFDTSRSDELKALLTALARPVDR